MALGSRLLAVCVSMACVLSAARCSDGGQSECPCSGIPRWPRTEPPPQDCHQLNRTFRYTCIKGYVRTAGTSNLIKCNPGTSRWSNPHPTFECKHPRGGAAHASNSTDADAVTTSDASLSQSSSFTSGSGIFTITIVCSILGAVVLIGFGLLLCKMRCKPASRPLQTAAEGLPLNEATSR
ncbi:interleukin-15 receptor subunit alpha isoform X2 [Vanacampus margaritifer]